MSTPPSASPGGNAAAYLELQDIIRAVTAEYSRQLLAARRDGDQQREDEVTAQLHEATADQNRIDNATAQEVAQLTALYRERHAHLRADDTADTDGS